MTGEEEALPPSLKLLALNTFPLLSTKLNPAVTGIPLQNLFCLRNYNSPLFWLEQFLQVVALLEATVGAGELCWIIF